MRFLVDAQLPPGLARHLAELGHVAEHVRDVGLGAAEDLEIWEHARQRDAVLVTKDQDFVALAQLSVSGPAVVWIRLGNTTNRALWSALAPLMDSILAALRQGERLIEIA